MSNNEEYEYYELNIEPGFQCYVDSNHRVHIPNPIVNLFKIKRGDIVFLKIIGIGSKKNSKKMTA